MDKNERTEARLNHLIAQSNRFGTDLGDLVYLAYVLGRSEGKRALAERVKDEKLSAALRDEYEKEMKWQEAQRAHD